MLGLTPATTKIPLPTDNIDELVGTWVNTDYKSLWRSQKWVLKPDGVYFAYTKIEDTRFLVSGKIELIEKWTDSKGNIFCKIRSDQFGTHLMYELKKISNSGTVCEHVESDKDYPTEINPNDETYRIHYRPPAIDAGADGVLFAIGKEDSSRYDFKRTGWTIIGVGLFYPHLYATSAAEAWNSSAVARVRIIFNLSRSFEKLNLRLVRAGSETTLVTLDNTNNYKVTSDMLGSNEYNFGSYEPNLGPLEKGIHNIELSAADDGKGNGRYGWDAIALIAKQ